MTLVEILEQVIVEHNTEFNKIIKDATDHQNVAHTAVLVGLMSAINIVKEYICTWKGVYNHSQESTHYTLSCGNEYFDNYMGEDVDIFKYCPYCGGEIEFSEV